MTDIEDTALAMQFHTVEELRMYETLATNATDYTVGFLQHLPRARTALLQRLIAALWREDITAIRTAGRRLEGSADLPDRVASPALEPQLGGVWPGRWHVHDLDGHTMLAFPLRAEHACDRIEPGSPVLCLRAEETTVIETPHELIALLAQYRPGPSWELLVPELANTGTNLALAYARSEKHRLVLRQAAIRLDAPDTVGLAELIATGAAHEDVTVFFERLNTDGHNLHPCGRGRLGMQPADVLRYDLESEAPTELILTGIRRAHVESTPDGQGRDIGQLLRAEYPLLDTAIREHCQADHLDPADYVFVPVHAWQLEHVIRPLFVDEITSRVVLPVPAARLAGVPTASVRTLLTERSPTGQRWLVKTALDIIIGSTRRSISAHTTSNGPVYSQLLRRIIDDEPALTDRIVLLDELAGASYRPRGDETDPDRWARVLSALVRNDISAYLSPGELPMPACALLAHSPVTGQSLLVELLTRYTMARGEPDFGVSGLHFVDEYIALLLPVSVILMTKYGIGVEAHLQNCVFTFVDGVPNRLILRDWGGMRIYPPRLRQRGLQLDLRPGAVTVTDDVHVMRAKVIYTVLSNHLGEVIAHLVARCGVDPRAAWQRIRAAVEGLFADLDADPAVRENVTADQAVLLAPTLPIKAFVRMRLDPGGGDQYVPVRNPLHEYGLLPPAPRAALPGQGR